LKNKGLLIVSICIIVLSIISPVLIIQNDYLKKFVLLIFMNKENAQLYFQYIGGFLGAMITVIGALLTVKYQISNEAKMQKYINRQSFIRNEISEQIITMKYKLKSLRAELDAVRFAADFALNYEKKEYFKGMNNDKNRIDVMKNYNDKYSEYSKEQTMFEIVLENYEVELIEFQGIFNDLKENIVELNRKSLEISMKVSAFPDYTIKMMEELLQDTQKSYKMCNDIYELLDNLYKALNKFYLEEL
jgi:hypothetical protein